MGEGARVPFPDAYPNTLKPIAVNPVFMPTCVAAYDSFNQVTSLAVSGFTSG